jgi:hypothetical protein
MATLYPWGYAKSKVGIDRLKQLARIDLMEPEYARRLFAWIESKHGQIGIGGGWREVQPDKPGFAPKGKSFHQSQNFVDKTTWYMAVDLVHVNGSNVHRSPTWAEVPKQGSGNPEIKAFGVHCNVDKEPWHMQAVEVDGYDTWVRNGRRRPIANLPISGVPPVAPPVPKPEPPRVYLPGERVLKLQSPTLSGPDVHWVQNVLIKQGLKLSADSMYGRSTRDKVMIMQGWNNLTKDGIVGPKTWAALKKY